MCLAPFMKSPVRAILRGVTNDQNDPSVSAQCGLFYYPDQCNRKLQYCHGSHYFNFELLEKAEYSGILRRKVRTLMCGQTSTR